MSADGIAKRVKTFIFPKFHLFENRLPSEKYEKLRKMSNTADWVDDTSDDSDFDAYLKTKAQDSVPPPKLAVPKSPYRKHLRPKRNVLALPLAEQCNNESLDEGSNHQHGSSTGANPPNSTHIRTPSNRQGSPNPTRKTCNHKIQHQHRPKSNICGLSISDYSDEDFFIDKTMVDVKLEGEEAIHKPAESSTDQV